VAGRLPGRADEQMADRLLGRADDAPDETFSSVDASAGDDRTGGGDHGAY
jgi:hypothetical protein